MAGRSRRRLWRALLAASTIVWARTAALALPPEPAYVVPVHAIALADDDGSRATTITPAQVSQWVARANQTYAPANIQFVFDPNVNGADWETMNSTLLNSLAGDASASWGGKNGQRATANAIGAQHPGKVVVLFRKGPVTCPKGGCCGGCGFSWWDVKFIAMPEFSSFVCQHQNLTLFGHELGHYLGLAHTHAFGFGCRTDASTFFKKLTLVACSAPLSNVKTPAEKAACVNARRRVFDADAALDDPAHRVTDTAPDPYVGGAASCPQDANDPCDATHTTLTLDSVIGPTSFPLPRDDIMSYYDGQGVLTARQIEVVRAMMTERFPEAAHRRPDLAITAGAKLGEGYDPFGSYESPDIWIDSVKNGWGTYPPYQQVDGDGAPLGPGDSPWVGESNRIWFRARNLGTVGANDVTVKVYLDEGEVFTTKCGRRVDNESTLLGTKTIPYLGPLEEYASYFLWTPTKIRPVRIRVAITPAANELTIANNYASETGHVATIVTANIDAPSKPVVAVDTTIANPCGVAIPVFAVPVEVPFPGPGPDPVVPWRVDITPRGGMKLRPEGAKRTKIKLTAPATARPGDVGQVTIALFQLTPSAAARDDASAGTLELVGTLGLLSRVAMPARIACAVDAARVGSGLPVTVSGTIVPEHAEAPVALRYVGPSRASAVRLVTTDRNGRYSDTFVPGEPGRWSVRAFWDGDADHAPAESPRRSFRVTE